MQEILYKPIKLKTEQIIRDLAIRELREKWNFVSEHLFRLPYMGVPFLEVSEELRSLGMGEIGVWTIFARGARGYQNIHRDDAQSGLIIPIIGTEGSKMQWFDPTDMVLRKVMNRDGKTALHTYESGPIKIIEELEVVESVIANVGVPHRAIAGNAPRAVVSIKMQGDPKLL